MRPQKESIALARSLIDEFGGQSKTAEKIGIRQPSVCRWVSRGISAIRENDLRFRFPRLETWKKFPPIR